MRCILTVVRTMPIDAVVREIFALCAASRSSDSVPKSFSTEYNCAVYSHSGYTPEVLVEKRPRQKT